MTAPRWTVRLLSLAALLILGWLVWHSHSDFLRVLTRVSVPWIASAIVAGIFLNVMYALLFDYILSKYSSHARSAGNVAAFLMSAPAKYVPGKVWQAVTQAMMLRGRSSPTAVGITNVEMNLIAILQVVGLGAASAFVRDPPIAALIVALTILTGWALARFASARTLLTRLPLLRRWLHSSTAETPAARPTSMVALVITVGALVANVAGSWWLLVAAQTQLSAFQLTHVLASLWLGAAVSLLALVVPAGIGIREAAVAGIGKLLVPSASTDLMISLALLARVWQLIVDAMSFVVGWILWHATLATRKTDTHGG